MAKNRYINTQFWDDRYTSNLDPIEKLLFLYFITNPLTNIIGIYEIELRRIAFDTGIEKEMVQKIISRFEKENKIYYYEGFVIIVNFIKHQNQQSEKIKSGIERLFANLPENIRKFVFEQIKGYVYPIALNTNTNSNSNTNSNLNLNKNPKNLLVGFSSEEQKKQEQKNILPDIDLKFNKFWKFYNRREGNEMEIRKLFKQTITTEQEFKDLITATRNYNECSKNYPIDKVKYPINFLKCYKDFIKIDN
jgi:hypothetical protein